MIPARPSRLFQRWFAWVAERRMGRTFGALRVAGLNELADALRRGPVLVVSNHTAWWDPLTLLVLCVRHVDAEPFAMMDARNLRSLPFFGLVGAFGVELDDPRDGARAVRYAARLLDGPRRLVWIFPQGREVPVSEPLTFLGGAAAVARRARGASVVPAAIRYEFSHAAKPDVFVAFGPPMRANADAADAQGKAVASQLERIAAALATGAPHEFDALFSAPPGRSLAEAALAWLTRPRRRLHGRASSGD